MGERDGVGRLDWGESEDGQEVERKEEDELLEEQEGEEEKKEEGNAGTQEDKAQKAPALNMHLRSRGKTTEKKLPTKSFIVKQRKSSRLQGKAGSPFPEEPSRRGKSTAKDSAPTTPEAAASDKKFFKPTSPHEETLLSLLKSVHVKAGDESSVSEDPDAASPPAAVQTSQDPTPPSSPDLGNGESADQIGSAGILTQQDPTDYPPANQSSSPTTSTPMRSSPPREDDQEAPSTPTTATPDPKNNTTRNLEDVRRQLSKTPAPAPNFRKGEAPAKAVSVPKKKKTPLVSFIRALGGPTDEAATPCQTTQQNIRTDLITPPPQPSFL